MSIWQRLKSGLSKSSENITAGLKKFVGLAHLSTEDCQAIEEILIKADLGQELARNLCAKLRRDPPKDGAFLPNLANYITESLESYQGVFPAVYQEKPAIEFVMLVGVNGGGKTTSLAKIANIYKSMGKKPLLVAGDSFRAAAVEQLALWAERIGVDFYRKGDNCDVASIAFDGYEHAKKIGCDVVLMDTAGRLHTKKDLMAELAKIIRVIRKQDPSAPHQCLLVLDATAGQNGLNQAKIFAEFAPLTGIIITKLDGTAKGGVVCNIANQCKLPIVAIGVGENIGDWQKFNARQFAHALLGLDND